LLGLERKSQEDAAEFIVKIFDLIFYPILQISRISGVRSLFAAFQGFKLCDKCQHESVTPLDNINPFLDVSLESATSSDLSKRISLILSAKETLFDFKCDTCQCQDTTHSRLLCVPGDLFFIRVPISDGVVITPDKTLRFGNELYELAAVLRHHQVSRYSIFIFIILTLGIAFLDQNEKKIKGIRGRTLYRRRSSS